jgi:hypothetical protein
MTCSFNTKTRVRSILTCIVAVLLCQLISAQAQQKVSHLNGTQRINDIDVTVTSKGLISILRPGNYCNREAGPYYLGYNTSTYHCATGSYTFTFNPPVAFVTLNFEGLSSSVHYYEEVMIDVNGHHYPITEAGFKTPCEPKCIITPNGNLTGCNECSSSGWNGSHIEGPIYTLTVTDSVIMGEPAGVIFGLYLSYVSLEQDLGSKVCTYKKESAAGSTLIIEGNDSVEVKLVSISDAKGIKETYHNYSQDPFITVDLAGYTPGEEYTFEMWVNDQLIHKKLIIW